LYCVTHTQEYRHSLNVVPLLTGITALGSISVSLYLPSLPAIASSLHTSAGSVKLTLTVFLFVFALTQLAYGPLADRFGRKRPILWGVGIFVLGGAACAGAPGVGALILARIVQAVGASAGPALGRAVIRDLFEGAELTSALAVVAAAVALSPMLGPFAGGAIAMAFGWRATFLALAFAGLLLAAAILFLLPETSRQPDPTSTRVKTIVSRYATLIRDKEYASAVLCGGCLTAGNFAWNASAPFVFATQYGLGPDRYGRLALAIGGGYVLGTILAARLSKLISAPAMVYTGLGLSFTASAAMAIAALGLAAAWELVVCSSIYSLGMGIVIPSAAACALSRMPQIAGSAAGLLGPSRFSRARWEPAQSVCLGVHRRSRFP
jgi:DHA1 family bicyclomycin/chloramphenicol resistance-like MFS transporter